MSMKKNNPDITSRIWFVHLPVFYFVMGLLRNISTCYFSQRNFFNKELLIRLISYPLGGLIGAVEMIPFFPFILILIHGVYNYFYDGKVYKTYFITSVSVYLAYYIFLLFTGTNKGMFYVVNRLDGSNDILFIDVIFFIIPSLASVLSINWFLFGRYENQKKN